MSSSLNAQSFYYSFNDSVPLTEVANQFVVKFADTSSAVFMSNQISSLPNVQIEHINATYAVVSGNTTNSSLRQLGGVSAVHKRYFYGSDEVLFNNEVTLLFNENVSSAIRQNIELAYGLTLLDSSVVHRTYKIHLDSNSIKIANSIHELGLTEYCYPRFYSEMVQHGYIPNDEYFNYQFYLHSSNSTLYNDGNTGVIGADISISEAWELTFGNSNIVTAVIDDGVAEFHDDLPLNRQLRLPGSNLFRRGPSGSNPGGAYGNDQDNPVPINNHGTACAGIIAAEIDNIVGIAGIAPKTKLMPIRISIGPGSNAPSPDGSTASTINSFLFAADNGADVINCSWGSSQPTMSQPDIISAINYAVNNGRNGKGCVIVFSAGNTANHYDDKAGNVQFPANVNIEEVISVGASNRMDLQANYSPTGEKIDVVAPSHHAYCSQIQGESLEIWTTDEAGYTFGAYANSSYEYNNYDQPGACANSYPPQSGDIWPNFGANNLDYTGRFGGTSAAAPQVAGLAALILSMNPCLTAAEVKQLIINNADKINSGPNGYVYDANGHSLEVGYGKINAYQTLMAVQSAMELGNVQAVQTSPITGQVSITTPTDYARDIEIASGGVLTINSTLRMARDRKIVVRPGGKLVLAAGSKITSISDCGNITWQGIQVGGNSNLAQTDANQGVVDINGTAQNPAIIENAIDAISTGVNIGNGPCPPIDWQSFGGIIKADYCRFENNLRDVQFMQYNHFENGVWQPNQSYFNHCTFVKDREFAAPREYRGAAVSMWDVQGVTFTACTFDNSALTLEEQNVTNGIYGLDANFTVKWDCQNPNPTTGCTGADSSYFKGMEYGIRAEYTKGFSGPNTKVHGTEFKSTNGLYIGGSYNNIATRNSFYVAKSPSPSYYDIPYGVYFDYAMNFTAQENEFYTRGTTGYNAGMVVNNHGTLNQLIYNNTFDDFMLGLNAQGENRSSNDGETGLECRCNDFSNGTYDLFVVGDPAYAWNGIKREQGTSEPLVLAGNLFSLSGGMYSDYFNLPDYINYHHHKAGFNGNSARLEPVDIYNVFKFEYDNAYNSSSCLSFIGPGKTSSEWQLELADAEQAMQADEDLLIALLNEENNWQLEAEILFASQYGDWYDVYIDLMSQSPFLDHGIIEGLIENTDFPNLMLRNIMLANSDAAKDEYLLSLIYNRNMPAWMVADIEEGQSSYGAKEVLVGRIGYNKGVQQNAIAQLLGIYGNSTSYNGLDSTIALLSTREEIPYAYLLAEAYLAKGQHTQAISVINNLPQNHTLSEKEGLDYPNYLLWYTLRADLAEENQTWFDVDSAQKLILYGLADTINKNAPMLWANHVLKLIGEASMYREPVFLPSSESGKRQNTANKISENKSMVQVYPNPASNLINVLVQGAEKIIVQLYTIDGKLLNTQEDKFGSAILNVKGYNPGIYLLKVTYSQGISETVRISIVK